MFIVICILSFFEYIFLLPYEIFKYVVYTHASNLGDYIATNTFNLLYAPIMKEVFNYPS